MQNYLLSIFHVAVRPESLPGADLSTFQKLYFRYFGAYLGPLGPKKVSIICFVSLLLDLLMLGPEPFLI